MMSGLGRRAPKRTAWKNKTRGNGEVVLKKNVHGKQHQHQDAVDRGPQQAGRVTCPQPGRWHPEAVDSGGRL